KLSAMPSPRSPSYATLSRRSSCSPSQPGQLRSAYRTSSTQSAHSGLSSCPSLVCLSGRASSGATSLLRHTSTTPTVNSRRGRCR
ncbi:hypothetical protein LTR95_019513, partial [Oleoguttula sp. CCFEE 5521]